MSVTINGTTGIDAVQSGTVDLTTDVTGVLPSANGGVGTGTITPSNLSTGAPSWTSDGVLSFNSGYGSVATAYGCRAWVNFNGTGTVAIRASGNVTSITDNGVGNYTVNFTNAMPDANYSVGSVNAINAGSVQLNYVTSYSASNYTVEVRNGFSGNFDCTTVFLQAFR